MSLSWVKAQALCCTLLAATALSAQAQKSNVIPLATSSQWRLESSAKVPLASVGKWGGDPAVEKEYGVKSLERRTYTLYPEEESVDVIFEKAQDDSSAYGLLTLYRDASMTSLRNLPLTEVGKSSALMSRGLNFIRITLHTSEAASGKAAGNPKAAPREFPFTLQQLHSLLVLVGGAGPSPDELRSLPGKLPARGFIQGSEKYVLGTESARRVLPSFPAHLLGFDQGAELRMARYRSGDSQVRVLAVTYPTPQIARLRFESMEKQLEVNKERGAESVFGKRTGSFVILVLDANSAASADLVLGQFRTTGYVTWNERYPGNESIVMQMVRLVLANLILAFMLAGFAFGGGLVWFASKLVARKWFPKSAWGSPDDATIIKLNLE